MKLYMVYEYVYDNGKSEFTPYEGYIMGFVEAENPYEACEKLGYPDNNRYFASVVHDQQLAGYKKQVDNYKKSINKASKQINEIIKKKVAEAKALDNICPNCDKPLDENGCCDDCRFGHEREDAENKLKDFMNKEDKENEEDKDDNNI